MPIEFLLKTSDDRPGRLVTVVSRRTFEQVWRPVAERLALAWVPMMSTGFTVLPEDIPAILDELAQLEAALAVDPPAKVAPPAAEQAL